MKTLRQLSKLQILSWILFVPVAAFAISWSMGGFSAPAFFKRAVEAVGVRVTQVCRPNNASYGAKGSLHKRCLAMDLGVETPRSKIQALAQYGLACQFHKKGYYGATADHWHCSSSSTAESRVAARENQRSRASDIRAKNKGVKRASVGRSQRAKASSIRRQNKDRVNQGARKSLYGDSEAER